MLGTDFDMRPSLADDPGPQFARGSQYNKKQAKPKKMVEALRLTVDEDSSFDDTFRLREAGDGSLAPSQNNERFARGVPIDDKSSSKNYNSQIIDGEHKSLLSLGKINESMEDDEHGEHILEHRILLSNPKLTETQRANLMAHIESHVKAKGKKMKELKAAAEGKDKQSQQDVMTGAAKYKKGFGMQSKALPATRYDVIPQDAQVDKERKRTAGNMSMESRMGRFNRALRASGRSRRSL